LDGWELAKGTTFPYKNFFVPWTPFPDTNFSQLLRGGKLAGN